MYNRGNIWMAFEFFVQEGADTFSVPSFRMTKVAIQGKVTFVKVINLYGLSIQAKDRHIEDGQVEKGNGAVVLSSEG